jgi:hypothetical protein
MLISIDSLLTTHGFDWHIRLKDLIAKMDEPTIVTVRKALTDDHIS